LQDHRTRLNAVFFLTRVHSSEQYCGLVQRPTNEKMQKEDQDTVKPAPFKIWVFGYASLCWNPGFKYERTRIGYVKGFSRKFWQGSTKHRGTEDKPGRVATLVEDKEGVVWGQAFEVETDADALAYLDKRECELGGYHRQQATFFPQGSPSKSLTVELYIAFENNRLWLGEASLEAIATQIMACRGPSGHNVEYVLCLAAFMHQRVPEVRDEHLFKLEAIIWSKMGKQNLGLGAVNAGESGGAGGPGGAGGAGGAGDEPDNGRGSFQFAARVPTNKLRCLNI